MEKEDMLSHVKTVGADLRDRLLELKEEFPEVIKDVRGLGLMLGMEVTCGASAVVNACFDNGVVLLSAGPDVVRFLPPFIITEKDVDFLTETLKKAVNSICK